jgi:hypothetical protein
MSFLRKHWFDLGGLLSLLCAVYIGLNYQTFGKVQLILWISLISLFIHQLEEYRYPGYFPGMINAAVYQSTTPDRYPLNSQTSLIVNVIIGWLVYLLAALFGAQYIWLGIATIVISLGNFFAHTFMFNIKGRTWYNPGTATAILLFLPIAIWFFITIRKAASVSAINWAIGIVLGLLLNYIGIIKLVDWMANRNTTYVFDDYQLRPEDRLNQR